MLQNTSYIDELTGVYNRRYLTEKLKPEMESYIQAKTPFSIAWLDIDHFKSVNDTHGHLKGDEVIKDFARFIKDSLRLFDTTIRYGGDEFICILPKTNKQTAELTLNRILKNCREAKIGGLPVTMSIGISSYPNDAEDINELLTVADSVLYDAKRTGRDRIGTLREKRIEIPMRMFVDRKDEIEKLKMIMSSKAAGIKIALIKGTVGIGKTRLAKEFLSTFKGKEIVWSDCIALADNIAYYPIREIIKYRLNRGEPGLLKNIPMAYKLELAKLIPEIMAVVKPEAEKVEMVVDKYRLYESVKQLIERGERDKVIVIDNIQWVDTDSVEVLKYLLRALKHTTMKYLFIHRTEEETDTLMNLAAFITREFDAREIALDCFSEQHIRQCISAIINEHPQKELVNYIIQESGGNPFYIEQIMRELADQKYLKLEEDKWSFQKPVKELVPKSIADIAMVKYQNLSDEGKALLEIASVLGRFNPDMIRTITGYNIGHIIGLIGDIEKLRLIKEIGNYLEFQDAISRSAIYERCVTGVKRRLLHQKAAEMLEEIHKGAEEEIIEELAYHHYRSKNSEKGISYCMKVGDKAKELYSNYNAIKYYKWAQELIEADKKVDKKQLINCLLKQAEILILTGECKHAKDVLEKAHLSNKDIDDVELEAQIKLYMASVAHAIADFEQAVADGKESLRLYQEQKNDIGIAKALLTIGSAQRRLGLYAKALSNYEDALKLARAASDKKIELRAHGNIGNIYINMGEYENAFIKYENASEVAEAVNDRSSQATILGNIGSIHFKLGNYEKAMLFYDKSLKLAREVGNKGSEANTLNNLGSTIQAIGEYDRALEILNEALQVNQSMGDKQHESLVLTNVGNIHQSKGDYDCARRYYEDSLSIAEQIKSEERIFSNIIYLGSLYLDLGETAKVKLTIDKAHGIAENSRDMLLDVFMLSCSYYLVIEDHEQFTKTIVMLEEMQRETKAEGLDATINVLYGRYYTQTNEYEKANEHMQKALNIYNKLNHRLDTGKVHYYLGILETKTGKPGFAQKDLQEALEIFKNLGAKDWELKVKDLLETVDRPGGIVGTRN